MQKFFCFAGVVTLTKAEEASLFLVNEHITEIADTMTPAYTNPFTEANSCSWSATCTSGGIEGVCVDVSLGCCTGTRTTGLCAGATNI
jgi:hypothetical protein